MEFIDTHAHLNDKAFEEDFSEVVSKIKASGCTKLINCADSLKASEICVSLAEKYDFIYATVGIHPEYAEECSDETMSKLTLLSKHKKVVAIGETGLDYHYNYDIIDAQKENFRRNIRLSKELNLPVVVHDREAHEDTMKILKEENTPPEKAVLHCYSGSPEMAKEIIKMGWYFSFGGVVTFKNAKRAVESVKVIPLSMIMLETDCPYMAPEPLRGTRNDSSNIPYIIKKIAEIKCISEEEVAKITTENAMRFFGLNREEPTNG